MNLVPGGIVINPDITKVVFLSPFFLDRDRQGDYPIGPHDHTAISVGLFGIVVILFQNDPGLFYQPGIIVNGSVI